MIKCKLSLSDNYWMTEGHKIVLIKEFGEPNISYHYYKNKNNKEFSITALRPEYIDEYFVVRANHPSEITKFLLTNTDGFIVKEMS